MLVHTNGANCRWVRKTPVRATQLHNTPDVKPGGSQLLSSGAQSGKTTPCRGSCPFLQAIVVMQRKVHQVRRAINSALSNAQGLAKFVQFTLGRKQSGESVERIENIPVIAGQHFSPYRE